MSSALECRKILATLALWVVLASAFSDTLTRRCLTNITAYKPLIQPQEVAPLRLVYMNWISNEIDNTIGAILLREVMGYTVSLESETVNKWKLLSGPDVWDMLYNDTLASSLELWPSYYPAEIDYYTIANDFVEVVPLGINGITGWYYFVPDSMLAGNPLLGRLIYSDFTYDSISSIFNSFNATNSTRAIFHTVDTSWSVYDIQIARNLQLNIDFIFHGTEDIWIQNITALYNAGIPFLTYGYKPQVFFSGGKGLRRLPLPEYSEDCYAKAAVGGVDCDYPADVLRKGFSPKLEEKAPGAYSFLKQLRVTNIDMENLLKYSFTHSNITGFEMACMWVNNNTALWNSWAKIAQTADVTAHNALQKPSLKKTSLGTGGFVGIVAGTVLLLAVVGVILLLVQRRHKRQVEGVKKMLHENQQAAFNIQVSDLEYGPLIGRGNFGEVYIGDYRGTQVAIKKLIKQTMSKKQREQFTQEVATMVNLRHPNILLFMGACAEPPNVSIITEYMKMGNLYNVLRNDSITVGLKLAHTLATGITKGMQYIHAAGMLHRDLKTPNILLDKKFNVKISDFGLSCMKQEDSALDQVSLIWTAPEILKGEKYTPKADVYSFGIILWELMSHGAAPYPYLNTNAIANAVVGGSRPALSKEYDIDFVDLMKKCWQQDPVERPTFAEISKLLSTMRFASMEDEHFTSTENSSTNGGTNDTISSFSIFVSAPPISNTTTTVVTRIQNSSRLWEWNPSIMASAVTIANKELMHVAAKNKGYKSESIGDAFVFVFANPVAALTFCLQANQALLRLPWPKELLELPEAAEERSVENEKLLLFCGLRIAMGVHIGPPLSNTDTAQTIFYGPVVEMAVQAAICAHGGQIVMTQAVYDAMNQKMNNTTAETLFSKLDSHLCEPVTFYSKLGKLYFILPASLRENAYAFHEDKIDSQSNSRYSSTAYFKKDNNNNNNTTTTTATIATETNSMSSHSSTDSLNYSGSVGVSTGLLGAKTSTGVLPNLAVSTTGLLAPKNSSGALANLGLVAPKSGSGALANLANNLAMSSVSLYQSSASLAEGSDMLLVLPKFLPPQERWIIDYVNLVNKQREPYPSPMGHVYKAVYIGNKSIDVSLQTITSYKVSDAELLDMRVEAASMVNMRSPYVCNFYGLCVSPLSLVWEYSSRDLATLLKSTQPLSFTQSVQFLCDIARGYIFLQEKYIANSSSLSSDDEFAKVKVPVELKPASLYLGEDGVVKIADYGFSHIKISNQTLTQNQTVAWTAPEVFSGEPENEKTAMFSFGIIMWQMLSRKSPWENRHAMKIIYAVETGDRPKIEYDYPITGLSHTKFDKYKELMIAAWHQSPAARPTFEHILRELQNL